MRLVSAWKQHFAVLASDKIVFFGSGAVAFPTLRTLHSKYQNIEVVTNYTPPKTKNFNQVEIFCKEKQIPVTTPITQKNDKEKMKAQWQLFTSKLLRADFGIVCSFGYMLPSKLIQSFQKGVIVAHPSLLPKYRGASPIFHTIANGDKQSGVSFIEISKGKFDHGNILKQVKCAVNLNHSYKQVEQSLAQFAGKNILSVIDSIDELRPGVSQGQLKVTFAQELLKAPIVKDKKLDINRPAEVVYNWSRALQPAKLSFKLNGKDVMVKLDPDYLNGPGQVGSIKIVGKKLYFRCADKYISIREWNHPTARVDGASGFLRQYHMKQNQVGFKFE